MPVFWSREMMTHSNFDDSEFGRATPRYSQALNRPFQTIDESL